MGPMACAYYAQLGSLTVPNAGGVLPLNTIEQGNQGVFLNNDGQITILRPGTYRAQFALSIPPGAAGDPYRGVGQGNPVQGHG